MFGPPGAMQYSAPVITIEELAALPLFAPVPREELARISEVAADIQRVASAVGEGGMVVAFIHQFLQQPT